MQILQRMTVTKFECSKPFENLCQEVISFSFKLLNAIESTFILRQLSAIEYNYATILVNGISVAFKRIYYHLASFSIELFSLSDLYQGEKKFSNCKNNYCVNTTPTKNTGF